MNQPKTPVDPGFADLNQSLGEVIDHFVSQHPEMTDEDYRRTIELLKQSAPWKTVPWELAPDAFEASAYDAAYDVYSGKIKESPADETARLARQMDYVDWVRSGGVGTQDEYEAMKAAQQPADWDTPVVGPRFRPTNYDAAVATGYEGTFSDWLRENVEARSDFVFQERPAVPAWHKVAAVVMVVAIIAVVVAVYVGWKDNNSTIVRTKATIAAGQA